MLKKILIGLWLVSSLSFASNANCNRYHKAWEHQVKLIKSNISEDFDSHSFKVNEALLDLPSQAKLCNIENIVNNYYIITVITYGRFNL